MTKNLDPAAPRGRLLVSLPTLAGMMDCHRETVRRRLRQAGIDPVALGRGKNGAIRYRWPEVEEFVEGLRKLN